MHPIVVIVGPTGSGKSDLGLRIASEFRGEIVSCDSIQVYAGLDIGSAKTPVEARADIPHHMVEVIDPAEELTAGGYARLARAALRDIRERNYLPVIVGGTGLYLRALFEGLSPAPVRDEALRARLRATNETNFALLPRFLRRYDPAALARIHANDRQKLIRAVELTMKGHRPASAIQRQQREALTDVRVLKIGLNPERKLLYEKLNLRTAAMFAGGLLEETAALLAAGIPPDIKSMQSLGYKQAVKILDGSLSEAAAIEQCQIKTRQYAKRQLTWFRNEAGIHWLNDFGSDSETQHRALALCREFLQIFLKIG